MSISLNALNDKINSMNVEMWYEYWCPNSKVHNDYTMNRTDFDFAIGCACIWDVNNNQPGQEVTFTLSKDYKWGPTFSCSVNGYENYWVSTPDNKTIVVHGYDAIDRIFIQFFKFNGLLKLYYSFSYNIIYRATHLLEKIFYVLNKGGVSL